MISKPAIRLDSYVRQDTSSKNYGGQPYIELSASAGAVRRGFFHFTRPFAIGAQVFSAPVRFYLRGAWAGGPHTLTFKLATAKWSENAITWANQPGVGGAQVQVVVPAGAASGTLVEADLQTLMNAVATGTVLYGLRIEVDTAGTKRLHSSEGTNPALWPTLEVEWSTEPGEPVDLSPAGGRSVAPARPSFTWSFVDSKGEYQTEYQWQLDDDDSFAAPLVDTGWVVSSDWQHTPAADIPDGAVRYWRVRCKDNYGLISPWSDVVSFRRDTHGVLSITNPPAPPDNTVDDTSPPITHTFVGREQEAMAYLLYKAGKLIWSSGRRVTASTEFTLPEKLVVDTGEYEIEVRAYDTLDREGTPGDPGYVSARRPFVFVRDAAIQPVTALEVEQGADLEHASLVLTATRAAQPDFFAVKVDGVYLETRIDPTDVAIGGGQYRIQLWNVQGWVAHTLEVEAVVLSAGRYKHSQGNPTEDFTLKPVGQWLVAPAEGIYVAFIGTPTLAAGIGESGETHFPSGGAPVRIVDGIRGYEGSLTGRLGDWHGRTAIQWRDELLALKGLPLATEIRLIAGDINIPVVLGAFDVDPGPYLEFTPTVPFWQVDEFAVVPL